MTLKQKRTFIYTTSAALLSILMLGNFFSNEFNWSSGDFAVAAVLLFGTAFIIDLVQRIVKNKTYKTLLMSGAITLVLLLIWAELAVGVFGTSFAGN